MYYSQRMPTLLNWQMQLLCLQLAAQPEAKQILADAGRVTRATEAFAKLADQLPQLVDSQREAAIRQVLDGIAAERTNLLANLASEEQKARALLAEARQTLEAGNGMAVSVQAADQVARRICSRGVAGYESREVGHEPAVRRGGIRADRGPNRADGAGTPATAGGVEPDGAGAVAPEAGCHRGPAARGAAGLLAGIGAGPYSTGRRSAGRADLSRPGTEVGARRAVFGGRPADSWNQVRIGRACNSQPKTLQSTTTHHDEEAHTCTVMHCFASAPRWV